MKKQNDWAVDLAAVRRELRSLLAGRMIPAGKRLRLSGDLVCLTAEADPSASGRVRLHLDPLIRPYVPEEILAGARDALEEEQKHTEDPEQVRQLKRRIAALRQRPPSRDMLAGFTLVGLGFAEGAEVDLGEIVFDEKGDAVLDVPAGLAATVGLEVPEFTFRVMAAPEAPPGVVGFPKGEEKGEEPEEWEASALAAHGAMGGPADEEDTSRTLRAQVDPGGFRLRAVPLKAGGTTRLTAETEDGGLHGGKLTLRFLGQMFTAKWLWEDDRCVAFIDLPVPFDKVEEYWPPEAEM